MTLPSLNPIPPDIEAHIQRLLQNPGDPALGPWLVELIQNSGHMSTGDDMRWRVLCMVWLAAEFDLERGWPYLMWLNMQEPVMSVHLSQILIEAVDDYSAHVHLANWIVDAQDERLKTFFQEFRPIPAQRRLPALMKALLTQPTHPKTGVWLDMFCQSTADDKSQRMRPWRLLAAGWYASAYNPSPGLAYLADLIDGAARLSPADNRLLTETAAEANGLTALTQLIADCPNDQVKTILADFGHPDLAAVVETIFTNPSDYSHLADAVKRVPEEVETFNRTRACLEQAGLTPGSVKLLDLACGPLAGQTVLLAAAGYDILGVDVDIPPGYLPLPGVMSWFKRNKYKNAWQGATASYYAALAQQAGVNLNWGKVKIELADPTRLKRPDGRFDAVICHDYLQHAPDVAGLLAEAARVLKPGGLLLADIRPYAGLHGAGEPVDPPWGHLHPTFIADTSQPLNQWREARFKAAIANRFRIEQWLPESDPQGQTLLTPEVRAALPDDYNSEELTRRRIMLVARRR
ncbi:MAG: methyltransferase domain-containing protein [Anaerolineaceae bacterium]|nr:methyltransferase domain-containing protein [Anaerolineaceae bacterium]